MKDLLLEKLQLATLGPAQVITAEEARVLLECHREVTQLREELEAAKLVADPDKETPELSLRERIMHIGEQAALLGSVNRLCDKARKEIVTLKKTIADLEKKCR